MPGSVNRIHTFIHINLPAGAEWGWPHIIKMESLDQQSLPDGLTAVDAIPSVLLKWRASALSDLLNLDNEQFFWCYNNGLGYEYYVYRNGREIRVSDDRNIVIFLINVPRLVSPKWESMKLAIPNGRSHTKSKELAAGISLVDEN